MGKLRGIPIPIRPGHMFVQRSAADPVGGDDGEAGGGETRRQIITGAASSRGCWSKLVLLYPHTTHPPTITRLFLQIRDFLGRT